MLVKISVLGEVINLNDLRKFKVSDNKHEDIYQILFLYADGTELSLDYECPGLEKSPKERY